LNKKKTPIQNLIQTGDNHFKQQDKYIATAR